MNEHPELKNQIGHDIVTTDGTTLLGGPDDKAGIAEIMTAAQILIENPQIKHGAIKLLFTTDEENRPWRRQGRPRQARAQPSATRSTAPPSARSRTRPSPPTGVEIEGGITGVAQPHPRHLQGRDGERHQDRRRHHRTAAQGHRAAKPPRAARASSIPPASPPPWTRPASPSSSATSSMTN